MFLLFNGLMLSSLTDLGMPFKTDSGRLSEDCDKFRAFCADPRIPSRLKFGARPAAAAATAAAFNEFGDLSVLAPLGAVGSCGGGISTVKSRLGIGYCRTTVALVAVVMVAVTECGESPLEDGDMLNCPDCDTVMEFQKGPKSPGAGGTRAQGCWVLFLGLCSLSNR